MDATTISAMLAATAHIQADAAAAIVIAMSMHARNMEDVYNQRTPTYTEGNFYAVIAERHLDLVSVSRATSKAMAQTA